MRIFGTERALSLLWRGFSSRTTLSTPSSLEKAYTSFSGTGLYSAHLFEWSSFSSAWCSLVRNSSDSTAARSRAVNALAQASRSTFEAISLSNLSPGDRKYKRRRARGGGDKRAGRGNKGQKSRSGTGKPALFFEGGQTPIWKALPRRGFKNRFTKEYCNVILSELEAYVRAGKLDPTRVITVKHLYDAGLLRKTAYNSDGVQILAEGPSKWKLKRLESLIGASLPKPLTIPLDLEVQRVTEFARQAIEGAGGRVRRTYYNKLGLRAVLLPEWFEKKGRLLPREVQMVPYKLQWRFDGVGSIPAADAPALDDALVSNVVTKSDGHHDTKQ